MSTKCLFPHSELLSSFKKAITVGATSLVVACGGGVEMADTGNVEDSSGAQGAQDHVSEPQDMVETLVRGAAIKGAIENGIVSAYIVEDNGARLVPSGEVFGDSVRTDGNGNYSLVFHGNLKDATAMIEITADELTTMKCDVVDGCGDDEQGDAIQFGDRFSLSEDFAMRSVVTNVNAGTEVSVSISPMTHMAVAKLDGSTEGFTADNVVSVFSEIEEMFDLDSGSLRLQPADITRLDEYTELTSSELELGIISASFLAFAVNDSESTIESVINDLEDVFKTDGALSAQSVVDGDVALEDVFAQANSIANDLAVEASNSDYIEQIEVVALSTANSHSEVSSEVIEVPAISAHPQSSNVTEGGPFSLSVEAVGEGLVFQWRKDGVDISGATSNVYEIQNSVLSDAGEYDVVVSNEGGSVSSLAALVSVDEDEVVTDGSGNGSDGNTDAGETDSDGSDLYMEPVVIVSSPSSVSLKEGEGAVLSVGISGQGTIVYQWRRNGVDLSGETSNSLTIEDADANDAGQYDVIVTNEAGSVASSPAVVVVDLIDLVTIVSAPESVTVMEGEGFQLSVIASGEGTISYQWRKNGAVLAGETASSLNISNADTVDAGQYDVVVSNEAGSVVSSAANIDVDVIELVVIQSEPASETVNEGESVELAVAVSGQGTISYQWRKDGVALNGETSSSLFLGAASESDTGYYDVVVTNEAGSVYSEQAGVSVEVPTYDVMLSWDTPLLRTDGSDIELYEIDGYIIKYGVSSDSLTEELNIAGAETSFLIEGLDSGAYYFSIATIDSDGAKSDYTDVIEVSL